MNDFTIYFDSYQEGVWFRDQHPALTGSSLAPFPAAAGMPDHLRAVLSYDRPDIVLVRREQPVMVLERTIEVPSGHNVGQRFARLVAAARERVPVVYFGPYAAYKHGGATAGPRYMNLRLFYALAEMARVERTAVTTIRWPVDSDYEIVTAPAKDVRVQAYLETFFRLLETTQLTDLPARIAASDFEREQASERERFALTEIRNPGQYDAPPASVRITETTELPYPGGHGTALPSPQTVLYTVGMTYLRSDPYTGMALLYTYLYCGGLDSARTRNLVLEFPGITQGEWYDAVRRLAGAKHVRLYKLAADGIHFSDGFVPKDRL